MKPFPVAGKNNDINSDGDSDGDELDGIILFLC